MGRGLSSSSDRLTGGGKAGLSLTGSFSRDILMRAQPIRDLQREGAESEGAEHSQSETRKQTAGPCLVAIAITTEFMEPFDPRMGPNAENLYEKTETDYFNEFI